MTPAKVWLYTNLFKLVYHFYLQNFNKEMYTPYLRLGISDGYKNLILKSKDPITLISY